MAETGVASAFFFIKIKKLHNKIITTVNMVKFKIVFRVCLVIKLYNLSIIVKCCNFNPNRKHCKSQFGNKISIINAHKKSERILKLTKKSDIISKEYALYAKKCALLNF